MNNVIRFPGADNLYEPEEPAAPELIVVRVRIETAAQPASTGAGWAVAIACGIISFLAVSALI